MDVNLYFVKIDEPTIAIILWLMMVYGGLKVNISVDTCRIA